MAHTHIKELAVDLLKRLVIISGAFFFISSLITSCNKTPEGWKYPDMSSLPKNASGDSIRYGKELISNTHKYIGPLAEDVSKRFAGNNLDCQNCHLNSGTMPNSLGFVGVYLIYPEYEARVDTIVSIKQRTNDCMTRSMNGKPLPLDGYEMNCIVAYYRWISKDVMPQIASEYLGLPELKLLSRPADSSKGRIVYADKCMACHAENGAGSYIKGITADGFDIPAVWGNDTYNNGAGMYRVITAAQFIKSKMPYKNAHLSDEEAWDVAAYINSMPHPQKSGLDKDFPNLRKKPFDTPYPPYNDTFSVFTHKYGPFEQIKK